MDLSKVLAQSGRAAVLAFTYFAFVTVVVSFVAMFLFNINWVQALMFGPMIAGTSSIVIIPLCQKLCISEETSLTFIGVNDYRRSQHSLFLRDTGFVLERKPKSVDCCSRHSGTVWSRNTCGICCWCRLVLGSV
jgi:hypothetical protein